MKNIIFSCIVYSFLFLTVIFLAYCEDISKKSRNKITSYILSILIVLLPCIFAAMRADTVGVDIKVYAKPVFENVLYHHSFLKTAKIYDMEIGYVFLAYACSKISSSFSFFLFATELFIVLPVYIIAYRRSQKCPIWFTMMVFLLFFYCSTFNIMRQSIAAAMLLLAYQFLEEEKKKTALIFVTMAISFHNSVILGVITYFAVTIIVKIKSKSFQKIMVLSSLIVLFLTIVNWRYILKLMINIGLLSDKYLFYENIFSRGQEAYYNSTYFVITRGNYFELGFRILFVIFIIFFGLNFKKTKDIKFYTYVVLVSELIYAIVFIAAHSSYGLRIIWFGEWMLLLLLPQISYEQIDNCRYEAISSHTYIITFLLVLYFGIGYIVIGWHGVKPLTFRT